MAITANLSLAPYRHQSATPDSPPATPPSETTTFSPLKPSTAAATGTGAVSMSGPTHSTAPPPIPVGSLAMSLSDRFTSDSSPSSSDDGPMLSTPLSSARPSVVSESELTSDDERIRLHHPRSLDGAGSGSSSGSGSQDALSAFHFKQLDALDMQRAHSARSTHSTSSSADWHTSLNEYPYTLRTPYDAPPQPQSQPQSQSQSLSQSYALPPQRPRSTSPQPPLNTAFSSSASYVSHNNGGPRERVVSPTLRSDSFSHYPFPRENAGLPNSPAADGKKEPSIRPKPVGLGLGVHVNFDKSSYEMPGGARARNPSPSSHPPAHAHNSFYPINQATGSYKEYGAAAQSKQKFSDSTAYWLILYFIFNLGLTLFNKMVLVSFPFPYTLTGLHALSGCAGCYFALERGAFVPARLTQKESLVLAAFSVLYTINIAVSNISLQLVTVPFHQVVRASTPIFTILISAMILRTRFTMMKLVSLLPVVAGVGFATYGDYYFTAWGLILTLLGTFLAALKTVVTNVIQTGGGGRLKLHPLDLLMRMSPLAFIQCVVYGWYTGELERVRHYGATQMTQGKAVALLINGAIACGLNIVSFTANKKAGALTMTVSANCKQVMTIALAVFLFDLSITPTNGIGIFLTLVGGGWYGYVEYTEKKKRANKVERS